MNQFQSNNHDMTMGKLNRSKSQLCKQPLSIPGRTLNRLRLVQDHILPHDPLEILDVLYNKMVTCDHHVERCFLHVHVLLAPELTKDPTILRVAPVWDHLRTDSRKDYGSE